jgi:hypothetical protein
MLVFVAFGVLLLPCLSPVDSDPFRLLAVLASVGWLTGSCVDVVLRYLVPITPGCSRPLHVVG